MRALIALTLLLAVGPVAAQDILVGEFTVEGKAFEVIVRPKDGVIPPPPADLPIINRYADADHAEVKLPAPGQRLRIVGSGFGSGTGNLLYNGLPLAVESWTDGEIWAVLPDWTEPYPGTITVMRSSDGATLNARAFVTEAAPFGVLSYATGPYPLPLSAFPMSAVSMSARLAPAMPEPPSAITAPLPSTYAGTALAALLTALRHEQNPQARHRLADAVEALLQ
jgi:hypothetical protein